MAKTKRFREIEKLFDKETKYSLEDAINILLKSPPVNFDQSIEISIKTGVDVQKPEQQIRGTVSLPHGTGKQVIVAVLVRGDKAKEATSAGADYVGSDELLEKIQGGWMDFSTLIATPEMMRDVGKLGKILGPRGLMPSPKAGTVTNDVAKAVREVKAGRFEFKTDKNGVINAIIGKLSFSKEKILENFLEFAKVILDAKPPTAKGQYIRSAVLSSTMGPGIKLDLGLFTSLLAGKGAES